MSDQIEPVSGPVFDPDQPLIITGEFSRLGPGDASSEGVLRRYLLVRALGRSLINAVQWSGLSILVIAVLCWLGGVKVLGVLIGLVAIFVLLLRAMLAAVERRLAGSEQLGEAGPRVNALVSKTRRGLRKELRRVGLPAAPWAPLLIVLRLIRPYRRIQTVHALAGIDLSAVVPAAQLDELHLLLQRPR